MLKWKEKKKTVLVCKWVILHILQSVSSHGFSTEIKFPVLAVSYFTMYREYYGLAVVGIYLHYKP